MSESSRWRLKVEHTTTYWYASPAHSSYNEVRLIPMSTARQTTMESSITTTPGSSPHRYKDYWGTTVVAFDIPGQHQELTVRSSAIVETKPPAIPTPAPWSVIHSDADSHIEFLTPSRYTTIPPGVAGIIHELRTENPIATVEKVAAWVNESLRYVPGITGVSSTAGEAWETGSGVCQDFAHLTLSVLRSLGIPARYVSGYLHSDSSEEGSTDAIGESHAWVEAWTGAWWGIDPTNLTATGLRHVLVARGRDYDDVPPVKGIYAGTADGAMDVEVRVSRIA